MIMKTLGKIKQKTSVSASLSQYIGQIFAFVSIFAFLSLSTKTFLTPGNIINVSRQISTNMYVACALTMILITGGIDLSTGSVMAVAGMVSSYLSLAGFPFFVCALAGLLCGAAAGVVNGVLIANTNLPPFIVTYSTQSILRGMVYVITTAGTLRLTEQGFLNFGGGTVGFLPYPVLYMLLVIGGTALLLGRTKLGRHMYAIGGNAKAAQFAGIDMKRVRVIIYAISGTLSALAGLVLTSRNTSMQPNLGTGMEMDAIAAVVLGGTSMSGGQGGVAGTVLGACIIGIINNGLNLLQMNSFWQYICKGVVILIAVYADDVKNKRLLRRVDN